MDKEEILALLMKLIDSISDTHHKLSVEWSKYSEENNLQVFNQKSEKVAHLEKAGLMDVILAYDRFLIDMNESKLINRNDKEYFIVDSRVKTENSIIEKCEDYCKYAPHKGEVSVNKCLNDLFGVRVIVDCPDISLADIECCLKNRNDLKLEDKNFDGECSSQKYKAVHVYFKGKGDKESNNKAYRWELQIWKKGQEEFNNALHLKHRFKYTKWEGEEDGGN